MTETEEKFWKTTKWYHGTTLKNFLNITGNGVIANINKHEEKDFGWGFYLCPSKEWCEEYVRTAPDWEPAKSVIIEFAFAPVKFKETFSYKIIPERNDIFYEFIFQNRITYKHHIFSKCAHNIGMIYGPMADGNFAEASERYRHKLISKRELFDIYSENPAGCDWQLALHSQKLCDKLIITDYTII